MTADRKRSLADPSLTIAAEHPGDMRDPRLADRLDSLVSRAHKSVTPDGDLEREVLWHVNCGMNGDGGYTFLRSHSAAVSFIAQLLRYNCFVGDNEWPPQVPASQSSERALEETKALLDESLGLVLELLGLTRLLNNGPEALPETVFPVFEKSRAWADKVLALGKNSQL